MQGPAAACRRQRSATRRVRSSADGAVMLASKGWVTAPRVSSARRRT